MVEYMDFYAREKRCKTCKYYNEMNPYCGVYCTFCSMSPVPFDPREDLYEKGPHMTRYNVRFYYVKDDGTKVIKHQAVWGRTEQEVEEKFRHAYRGDDSLIFDCVEGLYVKEE